ncbi:unnamed protein product [Boreogadus saida]
MSNSLRLYVGIVTALALCKYCLAEWNSTEESSANRTVSCHHHGNLNNCTVESKDTGQWSGHFTKCPKELKYYCIHGSCRYIKEQSAPSCRCDGGFTGSRCEILDLGWQIGEKKQIIIICVVAGLVLLVLLIIFICLCSHRRFRRPNDPIYAVRDVINLCRARPPGQNKVRAGESAGSGIGT